MVISIADLIGAILALMGALIVASQSILVRKSTIGGSIKKLVGTVLLVNVITWTIISFLAYYPDFKVNLISLISFGLSGFFGFFLGYRLMFLAIQRIGASRTMPLIRTQVIIALILSISFLGESLSFFHLIGIVMILFGTGLVSKEIANEKNSIFSGKKLGLIDLSIPLIGGLSWGLNWFFTKLGLIEGTPVILGLAISSIGGFIGFVVLEGIFQKEFSFKKVKSPKLSWYILIGFVCALAFFLNFSALSISRVVVVNPIWQVSPLFVLILSYIFLPRLEKISSKLIIGSVVIVFGTITVILFM
ncbi:MAG: EamA family transporter [Candidatus Thermoplasmatota archaeon]|nr:EamA family transporter [Candidatus Thermoplasmatota archaeon]MBS3789764.1 EamA family transporter [Candidatus Thermoplasmatota archaeon]